MKKFITLAILLIALGANKSFAKSADLFKYDKVTISNEMVHLDQLEGYLLENPGMTLAKLTSEGNALATLPGDSNGVAGLNLTNDQVGGIPGFYWGCCLGVWGILIVALVSKDDIEINQALRGFLLSLVGDVVLVGGCYIVVFVLALTPYYY
jgi:hypothetical protein